MNEHSILVRVTTFVDDPATETVQMTVEHIFSLLEDQGLDAAILEAVTRRLPSDDGNGEDAS